MSVFRDERVWRYLTNFWTFILIAFLVIDFASKDTYGFMTPSFSIIYTGVLSLYVGTKEFDRWYELHDSRHPGEIFVAVWTVVIFSLFGFGLILGGGYRISSEAIADYIMVLSIFALTQKSKKLHHKRRHHHRIVAEHPHATTKIYEHEREHGREREHRGSQAAHFRSHAHSKK